MSEANELIEKLPDAYIPEQAAGLEMTVQFMIEQPMFAVVEKEGCQVHYGQAQSPDLVVTLADKDVAKLLCGKLNGVMAIMTGRLKVEGDLVNARKLPEMFDRDRLR